MNESTPPTAVTTAPVGVVFRILGSVEVCSSQGAVRIPPGRQQVILAALLLNANRVVGVDQLIDAVWDENPPNTARSQIQICVSALRQTLSSVGLDQTIVTKAPGYLLRVTEQQLDLRVFRAEVARAGAQARAGLSAEAAKRFRDALELWQGPALGGDVVPTLRGRAAQLDDERLSAIEDCAELELGLGLHTRLVAELAGVVAENPLRERVRGELMLALYRCGRQAEALEVYRTGRRIAVEELGIEPGETLRKLEASILAGDPGLAPADHARPVVDAMAGSQPHQLPADIADFTGREDLIEATTRVLSTQDGVDEAVGVVLLAGKAGVGKTTVAVRVAHRLRRDRFPDGQLYCSLGGMQADPLEPADVLARFLRAMGVPGAGIPEREDERAELYRSLLARRRMLVVLDDAGSESQVMPLLPGSASCAVIVTSRVRLTGIPGARLFDIDVFGPEDALRLIGRIVGQQRLDREPEAARALVRLVGGLSLALRIVAARLAARPHWSLTTMLGRLTDERRRLDELAHGDMIVRASLSLTHDGLDAQVGRLFRLLDLAPGDGQARWVAAALLDTDTVTAEGLLEQLVDTQLLDVVAVGVETRLRYSFHSVIRLFARERLLCDEDPELAAVARQRLLAGWLGAAESAHRAFYGGDYTVLRGDAPRWRPPEGFETVLDPLGWLDAERFNLCAAVTAAADAGLDELAWELAVSLVTLFEANSYFDQWQRTHDTALAAVRTAGNLRGEAALLCSLGSLHLSRNLLGAARTVLVSALTMFESLGDAHGLALTWRNLASVDHGDGDLLAAVEGYRRAMAGFEGVGDLVGQAHVLSQIARIELDTGDIAMGVDHLEKALVICREVGESRVQAQVLYRLGTAALAQGRANKANSILHEVLSMVRRNRDVIGEGHVLHTLGVVRSRLGEDDEAVTLLRSAVRVREAVLDKVGAARATLDLAMVIAGRGEVAEAIDLADSALRVFVDRRTAIWREKAEEVLDLLASGRPVPGS